MLPPGVVEDLIKALRSLSGEQFQHLIAEYFRRRSDEYIEVVSGPRRGPDDGIDITMRRLRDQQLVLVECKKGGMDSGVVDKLVVRAIELGAGEIIVCSVNDVPSAARRHSTHVLAKLAKTGTRIAFNPVRWSSVRLVEELMVSEPELLCEHLPGQAEVIEEFAPKLALPSFEIVPAEPRSEPPAPDSFYDGFPPSWADLRADLDFPREIYVGEHGIRSRIQAFDQPKEILHISITGAAGGGKTTILRRAALDAAAEGTTVLFLRESLGADYSLAFAELYAFARTASRKLLVCIDDAGRFFSGSFFSTDALREMLREVTVPIVILSAEEPQAWFGLERRLPRLPTYHFEPCSLIKLSDAECEKLVSKISDLEALGALQRKGGDALTHEGRLALCREKADRLLLIAMMQIRHGRGFVEIIHREYDRLDPGPLREAYALTCYFQTLNAPLPTSLIARACGVYGVSGLSDLLGAGAALLRVIENGLVARHRRVAGEITRYVYQHLETRRAAFERPFSVLDLTHLAERRFLVKVLASPRAPNRILSRLAWDKDVVTSLLEDLAERSGGLDIQSRKLIATWSGMVWRLLKEIEKAETAFRDALAIDPAYGFALRQLAWLLHSDGAFEEAAETAIRAAQAEPDYAPAQFQAARILTLNTYGAFCEAGQYYERAIALDPDNARYADDFNTWTTIFTNVVQGIGGDALREILPEYLLRQLRPGVGLLRALYGPTDHRVAEALQRQLYWMQEDMEADEESVRELVQDVPFEKNKRLHAVVLCNLARARYLAWYKAGDWSDPDELIEMLQTSIRLYPANPFSHCWLGTVLKEMKQDYAGARKMYDAARIAYRIANKASGGKRTEHPIFLNNMALLIMDEVFLGTKPPNSIADAIKMAQQALQLATAAESKFMWPRQTLAECRAMAQQVGVAVAA